MLSLRDYQADACAAVWREMRAGQSSALVVAPTGSGKSVMLAELVRQARAWDRRVLVLTHVKELIEQNHAAFHRLCPDVESCIYSAGLGRKETWAGVIFGGVQSVVRGLNRIRAVDMVIIDEAHLLSPNDETSYQKILANLRAKKPDLRLVGLTATPFRLDSGTLHGAGRLFQRISYNIPIKLLIDEGHLCPVRSKRALADAFTDRLGTLRKRGGEYVAGDLAALYDDPTGTAAALDEVFAVSSDRNRWLLFCSGVEHAQHVAEAVTERGRPCGVVTGDTPKAERADILERFKRGELGALANANVLTTGFDCPAIDLLVLLRATESRSLYMQMVGRGMRPHPGKQFCAVLDYGGNIDRHGPVDAIDVAAATTDRAAKGGEAPTKECPECGELVAAGRLQCFCGYEWPPREVSVAVAASTGDLLSFEPTTHTLYVETWDMRVWPGKDGKPDSIRVDYYGPGGLASVSEWVCPLHDGYARHKAVEWFRERGFDLAGVRQPSLDDLCDTEDYPAPFAVEWRVEGQYKRIIKTRWEREPGEDPDEPAAEPLTEAERAALPF